MVENSEYTSVCNKKPVIRFLCLSQPMPLLNGKYCHQFLVGPLSNMLLLSRFFVCLFVLTQQVPYCMHCLVPYAFSLKKLSWRFFFAVHVILFLMIYDTSLYQYAIISLTNSVISNPLLLKRCCDQPLGIYSFDFRSMSIG